MNVEVVIKFEITTEVSQLDIISLKLFEKVDKILAVM